MGRKRELPAFSFESRARADTDTGELIFLAARAAVRSKTDNRFGVSAETIVCFYLPAEDGMSFLGDELQPDNHRRPDNENRSAAWRALWRRLLDANHEELPRHKDRGDEPPAARPKRGESKKCA